MAVLLAACADWARSLTLTPGFVHGRSSSSVARAAGSLFAVAVEAIVLMEVDVCVLVDRDEGAAAGREPAVDVVVAIRRDLVEVALVSEVGVSRVVVLAVLVTALTSVVEDTFAEALDLVAEVLDDAATRFFGCGSGSLTCSTRSSVAARSSVVDTGVAAFRLVVRVATLVVGGAATRAGMVVGGGRMLLLCRS